MHVYTPVVKTEFGFTRNKNGTLFGNQNDMFYLIYCLSAKVGLIVVRYSFLMFFWYKQYHGETIFTYLNLSSCNVRIKLPQM